MDGTPGHDVLPVGRCIRAVLLFHFQRTSTAEGNGYSTAKILLLWRGPASTWRYSHALSAQDLPRWENDTRLPLSSTAGGGLSILFFCCGCGVDVGAGSAFTNGDFVT